VIEISIKKRLFGAKNEFELSMDKEIQEHSFTTLAGESGSGKTTLLRIIAGLDVADSGYIRVNGQTWFDSKINLSPQKRKIGFVFQNYSLFENMTIRENLIFALESKRDMAFVNEVLELVELNELQNRYPNTLSGGQKQRVALARAIVRKPEILLLDEPLSALDVHMRAKLQDEILKIHKHFNITTILVSHDLHEIFKLSSRVMMIENGKIIRDDMPENIYINKESSNKFSFIGEVLKIEKIDIIYKATLSIGNSITEVVLMDSELESIKVGSKVLVSTKAFNPIVQLIE
jgi:molybdate transport system ATP-binding protein